MHAPETRLASLGLAKQLGTVKIIMWAIFFTGEDQPPSYFSVHRATPIV